MRKNDTAVDSEDRQSFLGHRESFLCLSRHRGLGADGLGTALIPTRTRIIRNLCPPVRPSINIPNRRLAVLTGISTGPLTGRLDERIDRW